MNLITKEGLLIAVMLIKIQVHSLDKYIASSFYSDFEVTAGSLILNANFNDWYINSAKSSSSSLLVSKLYSSRVSLLIAYRASINMARRSNIFGSAADISPAIFKPTFDI